MKLKNKRKSRSREWKKKKPELIEMEDLGNGVSKFGWHNLKKLRFVFGKREREKRTEWKNE